MNVKSHVWVFIAGVLTGIVICVALIALCSAVLFFATGGG